MGVILDISKWQGDPDFDKIAQQFRAGEILGVIIRVQHGYTIPDEKYQQYVAACKQYGIPFGTYAYAAPISTNDAIAEANSAHDRTDPASLCFAVDIEEKDCADIVAAGQAYIDRLHALGMAHVGKYSYTGFYNNNNLAAINADWTWVAAYGINDGTPHNQPAVDGIDLWQFTSTGHVDGISTNVDESVVTDPNGFPFFGQHTIVAPAPKPIMVVKVLQSSDVRSEPSHTSGYIGNVEPNQMYNVWQRQGDWHYIILDATKDICGWVDGNSGKNLYWLDNPALTAAQPVYHTVVSGDTVSKLAAVNGTTVSQIAAWNNINPNLIYVGQKLRVK